MAAPYVPQSAVYAIRNTVSGKVYIGSSCDIRRRFRTHRGHLEKGKHHNGRLQDAWRKYGADAFVFEVVEDVEAAGLVARETDLLREALGSAAGTYNIIELPLEPGRKPCAEATKAKIRAANTGYQHTPEAKAKMSAAARARRRGPVPDETKAKIAAAHRGSKRKPVTEEVKQRIRAYQTGQKRTAEHNANLGAALKVAWQRRRARYGSEEALSEAMRSMRLGGSNQPQPSQAHSERP